MSGDPNKPDDAHPESNPLHASNVEFDKEPEHAVPPSEFETHQPPGLWVLFITEMWERFSYYGMRALFVLFLIASADKFLPADLGLESEADRNAAVIELVAAQTGVASDQITVASPLEGQLTLDAAKRTALISALKSKFGAPFPDDGLAGAGTVGDVVEFAITKGQGDENQNPGFGWQRDEAYTLYGVYTFMVYLTSIFGGIVADRLLGTHRSMLLGGWIIALGHITLAGMVLFPYELGATVNGTHGYGALMCFLLGCTLIIIGTGFFKPCVSVMVGQLYTRNDPRRDSGFTIFYMGINLGAFFSPLVAGYLGEKIGWHWGFGSAAIGMLLGLFFYQLSRGRYLGTIGEPPAGPIAGNDKKLVFSALVILVGIPLLPLLIFAAGGLDWVTAQWSRIYRIHGSVGHDGLDRRRRLVCCFGVFVWTAVARSRPAGGDSDSCFHREYLFLDGLRASGFIDECIRQRSNRFDVVGFDQGRNPGILLPVSQSTDDSFVRTRVQLVVAVFGAEEARPVNADEIRDRAVVVGVGFFGDGGGRDGCPRWIGRRPLAVDHLFDLHLG